MTAISLITNLFFLKGYAVKSSPSGSENMIKLMVFEAKRLFYIPKESVVM